MIDDDLRLEPLSQFTAEGHLTAGYGQLYLLMAGRDDVHGALHWLLSHETRSLKLSMYGFTDAVLNADLVTLIGNPDVDVQITLDKSQAAGPTEKALLQADAAQLGAAWSNSVRVLRSPTGAIAHTKGFVAAGLGIAAEGSTNWSPKGEGQGRVSQNNTLVVTTNPVFINRFSARLDVEHRTGLKLEL